MSLKSVIKYKDQIQEQEDELGDILSRLYEHIKTDMNLELPSGRVSWTDIQRLYKTQADDAIRSTVTEIYLLTAKKTTEKDMRIPFILTSTDDREIRRLSQSYQTWFWRGMENEIVKKTAYAFDPRNLLRFKPEKAVLKETFLERMVGSIQSEVAAIATITKAKQVIVRDRGNDRYRRPRQYSGYGRIYSGAVNDGIEVSRFVWRTDPAELNTCPQCQSLDGSEYAIDDPNVPTPVLDSHPSCRCSVELDFVTQTGEEEELFL